LLYQHVYVENVSPSVTSDVLTESELLHKVADAVQMSYCLISRHFHLEVLMPYVRMVHHFWKMLY